MTIFLRLLAEDDKSTALTESCMRVRQGSYDSRYFALAPNTFDALPGKPFAYWVSDAIRQIFLRMPRFEGDERTVRQGLATADDFRYVRTWWEVTGGSQQVRWFPFAKGGAYSPFYGDTHLSLNWSDDGRELTAFTASVIRNPSYYGRPGLTWPLRARRFAPQAMPADCIFSARGYSAFPESGRELSTLAVFNSTPFDYLYKTALGRFGFPEYIVGILQLMPWADASAEGCGALGALAQRAWSLKRGLDTVTETSHAFLLPLPLRQAQGERLGTFDPSAIEAERLYALSSGN